VFNMRSGVRRICGSGLVLAAVLTACGGAAAPASSVGPAPSGAASAVAAPAKPSTGFAPASAVSSAPAAKPSAASSTSASAVASAAAGAGTASAAGKPAAAAAGAPSPQPSPPPLNPPVHVKVIDTGTNGTAPIWIGMDRGYFKAEGLDIELVSLRDLAQAMQQVATNQVAYNVAVPDPVLFNAMARGVDVKILASASINTATDRQATFLVRQDLVDTGKYKSPADLKGWTIAVPGLSSTFYVDLVLKKANLTLNDVKIVTLPQPDILAAFQNRSIDAAWLSEPTVTTATSRHLAQTFEITGALFTGGVGAALTMSPDFGQQQPEAAKRFMVAFMRGLRDFYHAFNKKDTDPAPVIQTLVTHGPIKDPKIYAVMGVPTADPNGYMPAAPWERLEDFYVSRGIMKAKVPLAKYIDTSYLDYALQRLGKEPARQES